MLFSCMILFFTEICHRALFDKTRFVHVEIFCNQNQSLSFFLTKYLSYLEKCFVIFYVSFCRVIKTPYSANSEKSASKLKTLTTKTFKKLFIFWKQTTSLTQTTGDAHCLKSCSTTGSPHRTSKKRGTKPTGANPLH